MSRKRTRDQLGQPFNCSGTISKYCKAVKEATGAIYIACREEGLKPNKIRQILQRAGLPGRARTMRRWTKNFKKTGRVVKAVNNAGRPRALTVEKEMLLVGFVLQRVLDGKETSRKDGQEFLEDELDVEVSTRTIGNYFKDGSLV